MNKIDMEYFQNSNFKRDELINEAIRAIRYSDLSQASFGDDEIEKEIKEKEEFLKLALQEKITLPKKLWTEPLTDIENSEISPRKLEENNFFQVEIPVGLKARTRWAFTNLECHLRFFTEKQDNNYTPIIHSVYPYTERRDGMNVELNLKLVLDSGLIYRVMSNMFGQTADSYIQEENLNGTGLKIVGKPIEYISYHYDVRAQIANEWCKWELKGNKYVEDESQKFRVVLMVPKMCEQINAQCGVIARHKPEIRELFTNFRELPRNITKLINGGFHVEEYEPWSDILKAQ